MRLGRFLWKRGDGTVIDGLGPDGVSARVIDVTGAGDAMTAGFVRALLAGEEPATAARHGHLAAALTVASGHTVRPDLGVAFAAALAESEAVSEGARP